MPTSTYTPLGSTKFATAAATYTFNTFPSTYTDLRIVVNARSSSVGGTGDGADQIALRFNGVTTSTYSLIQMFGTGTGAANTGGQVSQTSVGLGNVPISDNIISPSFQMTAADIMQYSNPNIFKNVYSVGGPSGSYSLHRLGTFRSTSAITSITLLFGGGANFEVGSTISLYGIKAE